MTAQDSSHLSSPLEETVYDNAIIKLIGLPSGSATLSQGGDLTLADGGFFPKVQGRININGVAYGYISRDGNVLQNVTMAQDPDESFSISVDTSTEVEFGALCPGPIHRDGRPGGAGGRPGSGLQRADPRPVYGNKLSFVTISTT